MTNEEYIFDWYSNHIWSRPKPSKICDGVGSFAIRDIPKGTSIYDLADKSVSAWISWEKISKLPNGVIKLLYDTQPQLGSRINEMDRWNPSDGPIWAYTRKGFNWQTTWFFQNHSDNPNVDCFTTKDPKMFTLVANRDIEEGEELFESYDSYIDEWMKIS
jgi:hypothetical protein